MFDGLKIGLQHREQFGIGAARKNLRYKIATLGKRLDRKVGGRLDQPHCTQMVRLTMPNRVRRHVGNHKVRSLSQSL